MSRATPGHAPCAPPAEKYPRLAELIRYLDSLSGRADLSVLEGLLAKAEIGRCDIESACIFGRRAYRRNTISRSPHYELLALCWRSGDCTPIHDHKGSSCAFRVIAGIGTEIRFRTTPSGLVCPVETREMQPGYICAAADEDIHQVANMQAPGLDLVTLHIYTPPIRTMHTYPFATSEGAEAEEQAAI